MYQYEFVKIGLTGWMGKSPTKNYREIIRNYASNGWKFVQIFAPSTSSTRGEASYFELIFEKELQE